MSPHDHVRAGRRRTSGRRRCRAATALVTAALTVSATVSGCGSSTTLSRAQLVRRADAICLNINRQAAAAVAALLTSSSSGGARQAFIRATEATLPLSDRGLAQLRTLAAPPSLASDWRRFLQDVQKEDAGEHQLVQAARNGDLRRGESIQVALQSAATDVQQVTVRDGFSVCGRPPSR